MIANLRTGATVLLIHEVGTKLTILGDWGAGGGATLDLPLKVAIGTDDADQQKDGADFQLATALVRAHSYPIDGIRTISGFRFRNVSIPRNSVINSAILKVNIYVGSQDDPRITIYGHNTGNAFDFVSQDVASRFSQTTSVAIPWTADNIGTGWKSLPDIKGIVQEIINRLDWQSNNSLVVLLAGNIDPFPVESIFIEAYEEDSSFGAELLINYTAP